MNYILYIDYKANRGPTCGYSFQKMNAKHLANAMGEATKQLDDSVYLMRVMLQTGKAERIGKRTERTYKAMIENRGTGWNIYGGNHFAKWTDMKSADGTTFGWGETI